MKINAFRMLAFGPFTDKALDFSGIENGLHVVFGENEAGKSSSLRALTAWLYGFGHRVPDDWLHAANKLAVSGTLALNDGALMRFTRYKRRKNDLIDEDSGEPFNQDILNRHLAGKTRADFENAYGISHEALRRGVESVLAVHGELGQTLFTATSGLNRLRDVLAGLEEKQAALFTPRAHKSAINAGLSLLADRRRKIREVSASHSQWKKMKQALEQSEARRQQIETRLSELNRTIGATARYRDALNYVTRYEQVEAELRELASVPELSEDFAQQRIQAMAAVQQHRQARESLENELDAIDKQMQSLSFDRAIVSHQEQIEAMAGRLAVYKKESVDSKALRARIHQTRRDAEDVLHTLNPELRIDSVETMRLSRPVRGKLQKLASQHTRLEQSAETAEKDLKAVDARLKSISAQLSRTARPCPVGELRSCLERATAQGDLESRLSGARTEAEMMRARIDKELAALGLWRGDLEELERLALPTDETIRRFAGRLDEAGQRLAALEEEIRRTRRERAAKRQELDTATRHKDLPDPQDLRARREIRDRGWRCVRSVWLEGGRPDPGFLELFPDHPGLAEAYETSVRRADRTADLLCSEAGEIAVARTLKNRIIELEEACRAAEQQQDEWTRRRQDTLARWRSLWEPLGIETLLPAEMMEWSGRVRRIRQNAMDYHEKVSRQALVEAAIKTVDTELAAILDRLSIPVPRQTGHGALVDLSKRAIRENEELAAGRRELESRIGELTDRKQEIEQNIDALDARKEQWSVQWAAAVAPLGLPADAGPDEIMEYIDALDAVFKKIDDGNAGQQRIDAMDRNRRTFREAVEDVAARLAPSLKGADTEAAVAGLKGMLADHLQRRQHYQMLETERRKKTPQLADARKQIAGNQEILRQLCAEAGTSDPDRLSEVERQSRQKSTVVKEAAAIKTRLSELASGQPLPAFIEEVRQQDPDTLAARLEKAKTDKADLTREREALVAEIAVAASDLSKFDGRSRAARLAVEADGLAGKIQSDVAYYVKLRLASAILAKAIERYRRDNQSPVLEAAGQYFRTLTRGSFHGLKADFDTRGEPVLKAVRASDGTGLSIEALSDGTRDQMFLALRLGGLSRHIDNSGGMPFIVDDVLVHFDDARASAALLALADLAEKTQVIFFTHHRHLLALAEQTVPRQVLGIHYLMDS